MLQMTAIGYIGKAATVSEKPEISVINFSVGINKKFKDAKGNTQEKATWVACSYWVKSTALAQYLKPGTLVMIQGEPSNYFYHDKQGQPKVVLQCNCYTVQLLKVGEDKPGQQAQQNTPAPASSLPDVAQMTEPIDDLPF